MNQSNERDFAGAAGWGPEQSGFNFETVERFVFVNFRPYQQRRIKRFVEEGKLAWLLAGGCEPDFLRTRGIFADEGQVALLGDRKRGRHDFAEANVFARARGR